MKRIRNILLLSLIFLTWSCAQILSPTGGPIDAEPPKLVNSYPPHKTINFNGHQFKLDFDEFFNLQNPNNSVLISPPLLSKPEFKIKGKSLLINIIDTLKPNTTYSFNFSNCIRDITENNTIKTLNYVFSTGDFIDSNTIIGSILNAETLIPEKEISVLLYKSNIDSMPLSEKPFYLTKTDDAGKFIFNYLSNGLYSIYALSDKNSNMMFDPPLEAFAFYHKLVESKSFDKITEEDHVKLKLFVHTDTIQRINRSFSSIKGIQSLVFKNPLQNFDFQILNPDITKNRFYVEHNQTIDTTLLYDLGSTIDTIFVKIMDKNFIDTIKFVTQQDAPRRSLKKGLEDDKHLKSHWLNAENSYIPTSIEFSYPIKDIIKTDFIIIKDESDTIFGKLVKNDSLLKKINLIYDKKSKSKYHIIIPDSAILGFNGLVNDTLNEIFNVKEDSDYGHFSLNITYSKDIPVIIEIINEKGNSIDKRTIENSTVLNYKNMLPQNCKVLIIFDINQNGKWDTGNYFSKTHPEPRYYFDKTISVKANWEIEEKINLDEILLKLKTE